MDHAGLIRALGGYKAVAVLTRKSPTTVHKWQRRGVPPAYWGRLVRLAQARGLLITLEEIERTAPQVTFRGARVRGP